MLFLSVLWSMNEWKTVWKSAREKYYYDYYWRLVLLLFLWSFRELYRQCRRKSIMEAIYKSKRTVKKNNNIMCENGNNSVNRIRSSIIENGYWEDIFHDLFRFLMTLVYFTMLPIIDSILDWNELVKLTYRDYFEEPQCI